MEEPKDLVQEQIQNKHRNSAAGTRLQCFNLYRKECKKGKEKKRLWTDCPFCLEPGKRCSHDLRTKLHEIFSDYVMNRSVRRPSFHAHRSVMCSISFCGDVLRLEVDHCSPENLRFKPEVTSLNTNPGSWSRPLGRGTGNARQNKSRALVDRVRDLWLISQGAVNLY